MRAAWVMGVLAATLAGCGQVGKGNEAAAANIGGGNAAGGTSAAAGGPAPAAGGSGPCAAFAGRWTGQAGDVMTIAPRGAEYDIEVVLEMGGETSRDHARARCDGGKLVATNRRLPDTVYDAGTDTVTFIEMPYRRVR